MSLRLGRLYTSSNGGSTWTERRPDGIDIDREWNVVASDSDGSFIIAAQYSGGAGHKGRFYTSSNFGVNWTERQPAGNGEKYWQAIACSDDGSFIVACEQTGRVWISSDSGVNWSEVRPNGDVNGNWLAVDCDSDGSVIILDDGDYIYWSSNSGTSWSSKTRRPSYQYTVACNDDGSLMAYVDYYSGGRIIVSDDGGSNWYYTGSLGFYPLVRIGKSSDEFLTVITIGYQYKGTWSFIDHSMTWGDAVALPAFVGMGDIDYDVSNIIYAKYGGRVYFSTDSGNNFTETQPEGDVNSNWMWTASDSDGSNLIICSFHYEEYVPPALTNRQMSFMQFQRNSLRVR